MRKYYIVLGLIITSVAVMIVLIILTEQPRRRDRIQMERLSTVAAELSEYVNSHNKLPATMSSIYPKVAPSGISYERLSESASMLCAEFVTEAKDGSYQSRVIDSSPLENQRAQLQRKEPGTTFHLLSSYEYFTPAHNPGKNCYLSSRAELQPGRIQPYDSVKSL